ncbi:hypothetical protein [Ktedonobacter sp. SOSP1-52]|uniref:hypothetical protein n=1 Tax=Ktedonobacter sp. SOSP1-52 TaxID=2778366 RepID=UPI001916083D|nr:hypothetical protein [Ktedonobacter sp. SOSP1-52]
MYTNNEHDSASQQPGENVTREDIVNIDRAAEAAGTTREKASRNLSPQEQQQLSRRQQYNQQAAELEQNQTDFYNESDDNTPLRQDGYEETEGSGYGETQNTIGQPAQENPAQQGYDPAQSGTQPSRRQPGAKVPAPGRETGTAWAENEQMGYTTDTPDRGNPAN